MDQLLQRLTDDLGSTYRIPMPDTRWLLSSAILLVAVTLADAQPSKCTSAAYRQFDFWIGEWDVAHSRGQLIGTSRVERTQDGCALTESWAGSDGSRGQSYSTWDSTDNQWHQSFTDNAGTVLNLSGGIVNGEMVMEGERQLPDGTTTLERITWTPVTDGSIRQLWQSSRDRGMRRTDVFDVVYRRRP